jgi:hypothetical protein
MDDMINDKTNKDNTNISRRTFLKILCASGTVIFGIAGLDRFIGLLNKQSLAQPSQQDCTLLETPLQHSSKGFPFDYIIYSSGQASNPTFWVQRASDGKQLIVNGSKNAEVVMQTALKQYSISRTI